MSKRRNRTRVFLTEPGRLELATLLTPWLRVGAMAGMLAASGAIYFAALLLAGVKLRQFVTR